VKETQNDLEMENIDISIEEFDKYLSTPMLRNKFRSIFIPSNSDWWKLIE
jgi:hypothetical protein